MELRAQRLQAEAEWKLARVTLSRLAAVGENPGGFTTRISIPRLPRWRSNTAQIGTIDAQIKRNQASLDTARTHLDYTRLVAPMAGEVTQITTLQGQTVIAAQQAPNILTLADMSTMLVKAQVFRGGMLFTCIPDKKPGSLSSAIPQTRYEGTLKDVLPTPEKVKDAIFYYARFEVPNPKRDPASGYDAHRVHIQLTDVKNVLTIPLSALGDPIGNNRYNVRAAA